MTELVKTKGPSSADGTPAVDFAIVLSRVISSAKADPTELRHVVYELARAKLKQESFQRSPPIGILELRSLSAALETAIARVEAHSCKQDEVQALRNLDRLIGNVADEAQSTTSPLIDVTPGGAGVSDANAFRSHEFATLASTDPSFTRAQTLRIAIAAFAVLMLVFLGAIFGPKFGLNMTLKKSEQTNSQESDARTATATLPEHAPQPPVPGNNPPLPTTYGIFAVSGGMLYELDALPGRAPDQRVFMSAIITKPTRTVLPDGRVSFVVFRRDFASTAPTRPAVRVVAKIARALTFNPTGQVAVSPVNEAWTIRNVEHAMKLSPLQHQEMLWIRPEDSELKLSPGRYALVLNGMAYDFLVEGNVTATTHCLERTVAANGTFYSECRTP